jgi:hypothetical protein
VLLVVTFGEVVVLVVTLEKWWTWMGQSFHIWSHPEAYPWAMAAIVDLHKVVGVTFGEDTFGDLVLLGVTFGEVTFGDVVVLVITSGELVGMDVSSHLIPSKGQKRYSSFWNSSK